MYFAAPLLIVYFVLPSLHTCLYFIPILHLFLSFIIVILLPLPSHAHHHHHRVTHFSAINSLSNYTLLFRWAPSTLSVRQFCVSANLGELAHKKKKRCTHTHQQSLPLQQEREVGGGGNGIIVLVLDSTGQLWSSGWTDALRKTCLPPQPVAGSSWYKGQHISLFLMV